MDRKCCILCGSSLLTTISKNVRDSKKHKILKCKKCKHLQLYPVPTQKEDNEFYDQNLQDRNIKYYGSIADHRRKSYDDTIRRANLVKKLTPKWGKILEIGSGHGFFLELMRKHGYKITGIEISKEKRNISKRVTKAKILDININENLPEVGNFDTIVMFHVLEHIIDPVLFLQNVRKMLKHNGVLVIEVPNCDDFQINLNKSYREFYWQRAHIHYFTPIILKSLCKKSGLDEIEIIGIHRYSIENMFNWKLTEKPQLNEPTYNLSKEYEWIEKPYKQELEKKLKSDTIIAIGHNIKN